MAPQADDLRDNRSGRQKGCDRRKEGSSGDGALANVGAGQCGGAPRRTSLQLAQLATQLWSRLQAPAHHPVPKTQEGLTGNLTEGRVAIRLGSSQVRRGARIIRTPRLQKAGSRPPRGEWPSWLQVLLRPCTLTTKMAFLTALGFPSWLCP